MSSTGARPNILLLLTDQERFDLTAPGGLPAATPTVDDIAADGVRFERAYTPVSICSSARASLLTGLYPHNHGLLNNIHEADAIREDLPEDVPTFGDLLSEAGYANTYVGKWHVGRTTGPEDVGFTYVGGSDPLHDEYLESGFRAHRSDLGVAPEPDVEDAVSRGHGGDPVVIAGRDPVPVEASRPYYIAEQTIECMEVMAERDDAAPFFHRTDFPGPHHPYVIPEPYASMYDPADLDPWPSYAETFDGKPRVHENYTAYRGVEGFDWDTWAELLAKYMGFMTLIDEQMGRILRALDDLGLGEDTLVVHASDHGDFVGSHRQFNKGPLMYEDTYHIPLVACGPGVEGRGRTCDAPVSLLDLMPTFLDVGDVAVPEGLDGRSLLPLLEGRDPDWRQAAFAEYHGDEFGLYTQRMVRTDRYKFVYNAPDVDELYDLEHDPDELHNLADHPGYQDVRRQLETLLLSWMAETGDPIHRWTASHLGD